MGLFGKSKGLIGLDIGSSAVKACELKPVKGGGFEVVALGMQPLAPEAIVDGTILDSAVVIDAITALLEETRIKTKDVATSVSGNSVIIKKIALPVMSEEELAESIQWEAEQYIPFDIDDVNIDYQILGQGDENMDILLVAVKKDKINDYTQVISQAGLNPVLVEVDAFAMQSAFEANYESDPDQVIALVNVGASIININILRDGTSIFWRDIASGGNKYTEELQRELHLSQEQAEELKKGQPVEGVSPESAGPVLDNVTTEIATEIQKTFDFFMATSSTEKIHRIVLSGGTSKIHALESALTERFGARAEVLNPFEAIPLSGKGVDEDEANADLNHYGIAVGLGTRSTSDTRINLLREKRQVSSSSSVSGDSPQPIHMVLIGIVVLALGWVGFDFYRLNKRINQLQTQKGELEQELRRLEPVLKEKAELERKQALLDRKIGVIKDLKNRQHGPVLLLDDLSRSLPEYVWLGSMAEKGGTITLSGFALNANKLSDFVENLLRSGRFQIQDGPHYRELGDNIAFNLTTVYTPPTPESPSTTATAR